MAAITGANSKIGVALGNSNGSSPYWGTAYVAGAEDKFEVESLSYDENTETLQANPIGSGSEMINEAQKGGTSPTVTAPHIEQYEGPSMELECLLFGANSAAPMLMATGAYCHSILHTATRPEIYATVGWQTSDATAQEMPSALPSRISITAANPPAYVMKDVELLGDQIRTATVNTETALDSCTLEDTKRVVVKTTDSFLINAQGGDALAASDKVDITSIEIVYDRPLEHVREIRAASSAANGKPRLSGSPPFGCTVTVTLRSMADLTYFTAQAAGTEYKASLTITGDLITGSTYYSIVRNFPRMKIIQFPSYDLNNAGENPLTLVFTCLEAATAPTGMISTKPYTLVTNTRATALLTLG
jgi:hypothetical protein